MTAREKCIEALKKELAPFAFKDIIIEDKDVSLNQLDSDYVRDYVEGLHNLAKTLGVRDSDLGLNGVITLEFVASQKDNTGTLIGGGFCENFRILLDAYDSAFAHEWIHAIDALKYNLDHHLPLDKTHEETYGFILKHERDGRASNGMEFPAGYRRQAEAFDKEARKAKGKDYKYLTKNTEMLAHGMESWLSDQFKESGYERAFVVRDDGFYKENVNGLYPSAGDAQKIAETGLSIIEDLKEAGLLCRSNPLYVDVDRGALLDDVIDACSDAAQERKQYTRSAFIGRDASAR